jgi:hypothetical protein
MWKHEKMQKMFNEFKGEPIKFINRHGVVERAFVAQADIAKGLSIVSYDGQLLYCIHPKSYWYEDFGEWKMYRPNRFLDWRTKHKVMRKMLEILNGYIKEDMRCLGAGERVKTACNFNS